LFAWRRAGSSSSQPAAGSADRSRAHTLTHRSTGSCRCPGAAPVQIRPPRLTNRLGIGTFFVLRHSVGEVGPGGEFGEQNRRNLASLRRLERSQWRNWSRRMSRLRPARIRLKPGAPMIPPTSAGFAGITGCLPDQKTWPAQPVGCGRVTRPFVHQARGAGCCRQDPRGTARASILATRGESIPDKDA
jgi:hypothetical protein